MQTGESILRPVLLGPACIGGFHRSAMRDVPQDATPDQNVRQVNEILAQILYLNAAARVRRCRTN